MYLIRIGIACLLISIFGQSGRAVERDVIVYGGTSAGVTAAIQVARMGKTVMLIEPSQHVGGLTSGGLGMTDSGRREVIGGISREFYQRLQQHYSTDGAWRQQKRGDYKFYKASDDAIWRFEPRIAETMLREMLAEAKVEVIYGQRLDLDQEVVMRVINIIGGGVQRHASIDEIIMESGERYRAKVFIDATYEGDLMAKAGVTYTVGREANSKYSERLNGVQTKNARSHQFEADVDPYVVPGDPSSGLLPGIHAGTPGEEGAADHRVQAYCFRMCLTDAPENRIPFSKPEGYDPMRYELYLRYIKQGWRTIWGNHMEMPNRKTDTNNDGAFSTDNIGMNYDYPDGNYATREGIIKEHELYQKGLFWFLCNDPRVPEELQKDTNRWGLSKDEFIDNGNWPHQIYVREARRMVSDYVQTEADCFRTRQTPDPIGMGSYNMDSHNVQRYVDKNGFARNEGDVQVSPRGPYQISYRAIRPKREECRNLLVPAALSASHIAFGSIRMEPVFMVLGQSAGTGACQAIDQNVAVQDIDPEKLRERLLADKQVLEFVGARAAGSGSIAIKSLDGIVVDDEEAELVGFGSTSTSVPGYVASAYRHDGGGSKGGAAQTAHFDAEIPTAGNYEVRIAYTANPNRATNIPVKVVYLGGEKVVQINQQKKPPISGTWISLGTFAFEEGKTGSVEISNAGTDGYVIADAVQFLRENLATKPEPRSAGWLKRHQSMNARTDEGGVDLAFVGDSITQAWEGGGKGVWKKYYGERNAANYGISGDRTEHVLWRIDNGNFEGIEPKLIVIMIGTNNTGHRSEDAQDTADGIRAIIQRLRKKTPKSKILLLGVFPRGQEPDDAKRKQNEAINAIIKDYADGKTIHYLDIGDKFKNDDGTLPKEIMPDSLHLKPEGYEIWAAAIEPKVKELMGEK